MHTFIEYLIQRANLEPDVIAKSIIEETLTKLQKEITESEERERVGELRIRCNSNTIVSDDIIEYIALLKKFPDQITWTVGYEKLIEVIKNREEGGKAVADYIKLRANTDNETDNMQKLWDILLTLPTTQAQDLLPLLVQEVQRTIPLKVIVSNLPHIKYSKNILENPFKHIGFSLFEEIAQIAGQRIIESDTPKEDMRYFMTFAKQFPEHHAKQIISKVFSYRGISTKAKLSNELFGMMAREERKQLLSNTIKKTGNPFNQNPAYVVEDKWCKEIVDIIGEGNIITALEFLLKWRDEAMNSLFDSLKNEFTKEQLDKLLSLGGPNYLQIESQQAEPNFTNMDRIIDLPEVTITRSMSNDLITRLIRFLPKSRETLERIIKKKCQEPNNRRKNATRVSMALLAADESLLSNLAVSRAAVLRHLKEHVSENTRLTEIHKLINIVPQHTNTIACYYIKAIIPSIRNNSENRRITKDFLATPVTADAIYQAGLMHEIAQTGHSEIIPINYLCKIETAIWHARKETIEYILQSKPDVSIQRNDRNLVATYIQRGEIEVATKLVLAGAPAESNIFNRLLCSSLTLDQGKVDFIVALIDTGVNLNIQATHLPALAAHSSLLLKMLATKLIAHGTYINNAPILGYLNLDDQLQAISLGCDPTIGGLRSPLLAAEQLGKKEKLFDTYLARQVATKKLTQPETQTKEIDLF